MSASTAKSRLALKVLLVLVVLAAAIAVTRYLLRPTARVVAVTRGLATDGRPGSVTVAAQYELDLKTEVPGRVTSSVLDEGKHFRMAGVMAELDPGDIDITIEKAQNDYDTLKQRMEVVGSQYKFPLENAEAVLKNNQRLHDMGQVSDSDLDIARRNVETLNQSLQLETVNNASQLKSYAIALQEDKRQRDKMTIKAPFDGTVSVVLARPGALISSGDAIAHFITDACTVQARISEENFGNIAVGNPATVIFLSSGSSKRFKATVSKILPTIEALSQRYVVYLDVQIPTDPRSGPELTLKPGMTGEVSIVVAQHPDVLEAPRRSLGGNKVLVVNGGRVELRTVKVGVISLNRVEILDGLQEGDLVIADDVDQFSPGDQVRTETLPMP